MGNGSFRIEDVDGIPFATFEGEADVVRVGTMIFSAAAQARESGAPGLVFDMRQTIDAHYRVNTMRHADTVMRTDALNGLRIAIVGDAGDERLAFVENVAVNRGLLVKSFHDRAAAIAWVRAEA